jgi:hypothetical protein
MKNNGTATTRPIEQEYNTAIHITAAHPLYKHSETAAQQLDNSDSMGRYSKPLEGIPERVISPNQSETAVNIPKKSKVTLCITSTSDGSLGRTLIDFISGEVRSVGY